VATEPEHYLEAFRGELPPNIVDSLVTDLTMYSPRSPLPVFTTLISHRRTQRYHQVLPLLI